MLDSQDQVRFEQLVLPHLDAAYNLARWLLRSPADAEDPTQEAMLGSYKFFSSSRALGFSRLCARVLPLDWEELPGGEHD